MTKKVFSDKRIIKIIAEFYEIPVKKILSRSRKSEVVRARHVIMYFFREEFGRSYPEIARRIGGRDHTTAIYAYGKIKAELRKKQVLQRHIESIRAQLRGEELQILQKGAKEPKEILQKKKALPSMPIELRWRNEINRLRRTSSSFLTSEREKAMLEEWRSGKTLERIGSQWKVTRERVRQIIRRAIFREIAKKINEGFEIDVGEFLRQEKTRHKQLRDKSQGKEKKEKKRKRWSRYYTCCKSCGTTIIPHHRKGLCERCCGAYKPEREKIISKAGAKCEICGTDRVSNFQKSKRDFYVTRLISGRDSLPKYLVLCRSCFAKSAGKKMVAARKRKA